MTAKQFFELKLCNLQKYFRGKTYMCRGGGKNIPYNISKLQEPQSFLPEYSMT